MPHKSRYNNGRPYNGKKASGYLNTASKALNVALAVKKLVNIEYKSTFVTFTADPNSSGSVQLLSSIAQGIDVDDRIGNKIRAKSLKLSGMVILHASATETQIRMVIIRDNNGSTTRPVITDLYNLADFRSNQLKIGDPQTNSRFTVLWDKFIMLDAVKQRSAQFKYSMSLDHHIYYSGPTTSDEGKGNIYLFIASSEPTNDPAVSAESQIYFIDN